MSVKELELTDQKQECMQVKVTGNNFEFSFAVNCDGESANKNGNVRSSSSDDSKKSATEDDIDLETAEDDSDEDL